MQSFLCSLPTGKKLNDKDTVPASGLSKCQKMGLRELIPRQVYIKGQEALVTYRRQLNLTHRRWEDHETMIHLL